MTMDAAAAQRFLADQFDPQVRDVEPAGAGAWSRAFSFRRGADELIVRFGSHGDDFAKDRRAYRGDWQTLEATAERMRALAGNA